MPKRVRLIDIAERLNITKVSVSKALRDQPDISQEMRALVKHTAAEMGYMPNLLARSLSSQRSNTLGVVVPKIAHTFFASVIDSVQKEATKAGYGIVLAVSGEDAVLEHQHIERLLAMRVDGLLVSVSRQTPELGVYQRVRNMQMPIVFFDRRINDDEFSSVTVNDEKGAFQAVDYVIRQGYEKVAHIAGAHEVGIGRARRAGYEAALREHELTVREEWIIEGGFDEWHGYAAFQKILQMDSIPDAVFAVTFPVGLGIYWAIREHDPKLLDKIQIVTFGEGGLNEFYTYPHICVRQPTREMGRVALELLLSEIDAPGTLKPQHIVLETSLVTPDNYRLPNMEKERIHQLD